MMHATLLCNELTRKGFVKGVSAWGVAGLVGRAFAETGGACEREMLQQEIDEVPEDAFARYLHEGTPASCKAIERLDAAFGKVLREVRETTVGARPAVWLVYNMGIVVKTRQALFSVDLCHPRACELAPQLDFAVITHNHKDHYTERFYREMDGRLHRMVVQNFRDNCGFSRGVRDFDIKDVHVRTYESNHNPKLSGFVMPVELTIGDYSILHVGDTYDPENLRPVRRPDLWVHHLHCWGVTTARGVAHLKPALTVVAHLHEMQHPKGKARWTFADAEAAKKDSEKLGSPAIASHWGDRIV